MTTGNQTEGKPDVGFSNVTGSRFNIDVAVQLLPKIVTIGSIKASLCHKMQKTPICVE